MHIVDRIFGTQPISDREEAIDFLIDKINNSSEVIALDNDDLLYPVLEGVSDYEGKDIKIISSNIGKNKLPCGLQRNVQIYKNDIPGSSWLIDRKTALMITNKLYRKAIKNTMFGMAYLKPTIFLRNKRVVEFYGLLENSEKIYP